MFDNLTGQVLKDCTCYVNSTWQIWNAV